MYCPSCGTNVTHSLTYCNRCGANLNKEDAKSAVDSLLDSIFWITAFGLGLIVGGVILMQSRGIRDAFIFSYLIISSLAFIGMYAMHVWLFFRLTRNSRDSDRGSQQQTRETRELEDAGGKALPEHIPASVVEGTTRSFEPVFTQKKKSD